MSKPIKPGFPENSPRTSDLIELFREMILSEHLPGGSKLREVELSLKYHTSRTPVREALVALEREGLVVYERNKGFSVRQFSSRDVYESYELRAILEGYVCGQLAINGLPSDVIQKLRDCVRGIELMLQSDTATTNDIYREWRAYNLRFHNILLNEERSESLKRIHSTILKVPRIHDWITQLGFDTEEAMHQFNRDHSEIIDAIEGRDSARAEFIAREHVMRGFRAVADRIQRRES